MSIVSSRSSKRKRPQSQQYLSAARLPAKDVPRFVRRALDFGDVPVLVLDSRGHAVRSASTSLSEKQQLVAEQFDRLNETLERATADLKSRLDATDHLFV